MPGVATDRSAVEDVGGTVPATVKVLQTDFAPVDIDSWGDFIDQMVANDERNAYVVSVATKSATKMPTLVLVDRVAHAVELSALAGDCVLIHGGLSKQERATAMAKAKTARLTIGTTGLLGEGLDIAQWAALIMASPISSRTKLLQAMGRVVRPSVGKVRAFSSFFTVERHKKGGAIPMEYHSFRIAFSYVQCQLTFPALFSRFPCGVFRHYSSFGFPFAPGANLP